MVVRNSCQECLSKTIVRNGHQNHLLNVLKKFASKRTSESSVHPSYFLKIYQSMQSFRGCIIFVYSNTLIFLHPNQEVRFSPSIYGIKFPDSGSVFCTRGGRREHQTMECYGFFVFYIVILPPHAASESDNPPQPIDTAKQIVLAQTGQETELQKLFFLSIYSR